MAEKAREELKDNGADVEFHTYKGGHGWHGPVFDNICKGINWLENTVARKK